MKKIEAISFKHFLEKFPKIELPVTLTEESSLSFSRTNDPLPALMIEQFLQPIDEGEIDDYTEYIACFKIPKTNLFHAIVYWKAGLLNYEYILATFTKKGELIDKKVIAGTKSDGKSLTQSAATIDEDWIIYIVGGVALLQSTKNYEPTSSQSISFEMLPSGQIIAAE
ncbi:MAG: hypothetical protein AB8G15_16700 [Saprospiraceae bacterium]